MNVEAERTADGALLMRRCERVVGRLTAQFGWLLDAAAAAALTAALHGDVAEAGETDERFLEQTCCRLRFAALFAALAAGGREAEAALAELYTPSWASAGADAGAEVRYGGYLYRCALGTLRRRLARSGTELPELQQVAADAAARALTTVQARFRDCRDPDAFWGWTARVAERGAIDELRSGRATGGSSVHALSLEQVTEQRGVEPAGESGPEERQVDAIAVRQELLRKCRLGKLSPDQREAIVRSFWGDEKPREIAAALSTERGTAVTAAQVSLWKHRGLQIMEANLRGRGFGDAGDAEGER